MVHAANWSTIANANPSREGLAPASAAATAGALFMSGYWRPGQRMAWIDDVNLAIGIFDLFAYSVPGSLYLSLLGYLAFRLNVAEPAAVFGVPGVLLLIGVVLLSYLLGYLAYPLGAAANRLVPRRRHRDPRAEFLGRTPAAKGRDYVRADPFLLLGALQLHDQDAAADALRLRATGLMLRNSAFPLLMAAVAAVVEAFAGPKPLIAVCCAVLFAVTSVALITQGRKLGHWATMKTLELCFWLPDVDERVRAGESASANQSASRSAGQSAKA